MNTAETREWYDDLVVNNRARADSVKEFDEIRQQGLARLPTTRLPQRKQEGWRYTDMKPLLKQTFTSPHATQLVPLKAEFSDWIYSAQDSYRLMLVNGRFSAALSTLPQGDEGIYVGGLTQLSGRHQKIVSEYLSQNDEFDEDIFDVINRSLMQDGFLVHLAADRKLDKPLEIVHLNTSSEAAVLVHPRALIVLEESSGMTVVERFVSANQHSSLFNGLLQIELKSNARLMQYRLQQENRQTQHLSRVVVNQHAHSQYRLLNVASGGAWARSDLHINLIGSQAICRMDGLYTVNDQQYNDVHLDVRHLQPHCQSELQFRGILSGAGRGVFDGRILVDKCAQKTDARMNNYNMLLSDDAEIDTKPLLEIYADDVKCSHGSTVGSVDEEQMFYCQARGLSRQQAMRLLSEGFASQLINTVEDAALREFIRQQVIEQIALEDA